MFFLLLLAVSISAGCPVVRDRLITCFEQLIDLNHDSIITAADIDHFVMTSTCINPRVHDYVTGEKILKMCDTNNDGLLTLTDWTAPNACLQGPAEKINLVCEACQRCGVNL